MVFLIQGISRSQMGSADCRRMKLKGFQAKWAEGKGNKAIGYMMMGWRW